MTETSRRTLLLLALLQARPDRTGPELADRLGVDPRTVRRDVERLRDLGYRVVATRGRDGGYRLDAGAELPPLLFDDEQVVALAVALRTVAVSGTGDAIAEASVRALTTVRQVLPARLRHRVDAVDVAPVPAGPGRPTPAVDLDVLLAVSAATRRHEVLRLDHAAPGSADEGDSPSTPAAPRRVEPHYVVVRDGRWYLLAWDLGRDDWRTFRLDRTTPRVPTGPRFTPREVPGGDAGAFVAARFAGNERAHAPGWPCTGWIELAAPASAVAPFAEDGTVEALGPDRCRVGLGSWSWAGLAARVAAFDADVLAAGPAELVTACATAAARLDLLGQR
ncbi:putative DNA-binding transcriptional regulator YafY [Cellulosimicrobium cellulans]|uniref:helix-turn-helix transcriptional regulator n=1 Tax=Cellulosimicrobium cellulans TaxID=1710 RepID=UPI00195D63D3|nr:WYL domain-containing protein [Cellulosimicrobium cellulans]MBM7819989.1 putative DNA-binding transcriptional regulator YafY [Cellulosimicrobium cellulans]